jgi:hypothetical protein
MLQSVVLPLVRVDLGELGLRQLCELGADLVDGQLVIAGPRLIALQRLNYAQRQ